MIEKVLATAKLEREEIEAIAVGLGPGSYTGIRAAIALAQGWQLARGVKLLGVGSVECLAAQAQAEKIFGRVNAVIDAQRGEFYSAVYEISAAGWRETGALRIVSLAELQARRGGDEILTGRKRPRGFRKAGSFSRVRRCWLGWRRTGADLFRAKGWSRFICGRRILSRRCRAIRPCFDGEVIPCWAGMSNCRTAESRPVVRRRMSWLERRAVVPRTE